MGITVQQKKDQRVRRPIIKIGLVVTASAVVAAGASTLFAQSSNVVTLPFVNAAAINVSNDTVGFADSDVIGKRPAEIDQALHQMQSMASTTSGS